MWTINKYGKIVDKNGLQIIGLYQAWAYNPNHPHWVQRIVVDPAKGIEN